MAVTKFGFQIASGLDNYYLTDSKFIKGTYTVVDGEIETKEQLQEKATIVEGSLVYDAKEAKTYRWTNGAWVEESIPSDEKLKEAVAEANAFAAQASTQATKAGNEAIKAETAAGNAERINQKTMEFVNEKFWWGTLEEYNALESIKAGTFYFITTTQYTGE